MYPQCSPEEIFIYEQNNGLFEETEVVLYEVHAFYLV